MSDVMTAEDFSTKICAVLLHEQLSGRVDYVLSNAIANSIKQRDEAIRQDQFNKDEVTFKNTWASERDKCRELVGALRIANQALDIGSDWGAPSYYDIPVPDGWEDAVDPDSEKPEWLSIYGIIEKCTKVLAKFDSPTQPQGDE